VIAVCSVARPFGKVWPQRDVIDDPAGHRRASRRRVGGRNGGNRREGGFGQVGSGVQGDTPADQTGAQDSRTGDSPIRPAGRVLFCVPQTERLYATASSQHNHDIFPACVETDKTKRVD
jgi:hypothetical protein